MDYADRATIVGPATVFGQGGIGIVRISGDAARGLMERFFHPRRPVVGLDSHRFYYGVFGPSAHDPIDEVMAVFMQAPHSYTREDVVEIHCHGSAVVGRRVIEALVGAGCRLAHPGEFTLRAFLNGRIDLSQAEGVMELINSHSLLGQRQALRHLQGALGLRCQGLREALCQALAVVEAWIDFPEEDLDSESETRIHGLVGDALAQIEGLVASFQAGRILREGVAVLILGRPNVGKSSLLNALLGSDRAIVTDLPGTTRDTLEEHMDLGGLRVRFIDSAGLRQSCDPIEQEGVRRSRAKISEADLILFLVDGHQGLTAEDLDTYALCDPAKVFLVSNKCDLGLKPLDEKLPAAAFVHLSARTGQGLEELRAAIRGFFLDQSSLAGEEELYVTEERHRDCLQRCAASLRRALEAHEGGLSLEFVALELRQGLDHLGEITGETAPDEIINRIFSQFCIGK
ncbi:tRNA uridine-5-carboxymethylaminomethyl(34) synthesis GTPase MnmE [Geoalkalibacter halelectricus]|uniref:tRNA uridine-5-carboxymethylaminomethyl(34) synthesis GTPase MnmE n=1 Tax=Geoalkalibacter halelectricus TaxID=2847045 RepID=UPI00267045E7|nr:tRNA uridine-5-carboxymethylaminomethyl(34) synthesis GTPase MnmE [Geoalkalibacter halelectricus]